MVYIHILNKEETGPFSSKTQQPNTSTHLAGGSSIRWGGVSVFTTSITHTLRNSNHLKVIRRSPLQNPRNELLSSRLDRLVHQRDMAARGTRLLKRRLTLRDGEVIPVTGVDVPSNETVSERADGGGGASACRAVRGTHVSGLDAEDVRERGLELGHLGVDSVRGEAGQVGVGPGVRSDLVAGIVDGLEGVGLVVDAAVESACDEKGGFGAGSFEGSEDRGGVCVWAVVEGEGDGARLSALGDDGAWGWACPGVEGGRHGEGAGCRQEEGRQLSGG